MFIPVPPKISLPMITAKAVDKATIHNGASTGIIMGISKPETVDEILRIRFSYLVLNDVMKVIKEENPEVLERNFELSCEMLLAIRRKELPKLIERLEKIDSLSIIEE